MVMFGEHPVTWAFNKFMVVINGVDLDRKDVCWLFKGSSGLI